MVSFLNVIEALPKILKLCDNILLECYKRQTRASSNSDLWTKYGQMNDKYIENRNKMERSFHKNHSGMISYGH